ncbi:bifunctional hydroxymethylpyrimidine kinase/phosphomethylpyrimidine kinase [Streptococcus suis]|uniref:bifunctional hydroxymethylpyrimidine kinase/phosphomethylpyrimidine kinase n=1 Tax=Streptococcus suis TaxID=1307 RepID=UPI001961467A|nr:bifunctional hydroxymethylpyrimidine kinase/phosphomethylpyrimidine kinase [Streptococcus suis]MBM7283841.1 bifunctional hydroxymethylpyrimidine kinase/phosphomethylpyrimidine kinase [Streptococcus suis]MBO3642123.1 bifunctional hydroxymethylpyrimidine kinase/phosphomethylpyrimidine kinase [Streptococcus suis]MCO8236561.1 bifunctional hydroxymethylpyrimidine kinase/phosphomethylpyrimidine kinase [Streptococcus suis]HEM3532868.1 bifunctional hydroxymethylpyrimidine kinase/phosphomethylpyrimid
MVQRLLLANDLPGVGKVALATSIPIAAACQVETILLPTVLLSSHTGGFPDVVVEDMTDLNRAYFEQWKNLNLELAGILSGYCRNPQQLSQLAMYAKQTETPLIVDPVMGDGGKLYTGFTPTYVEAMKELIQSAKLILPNVTEAALAEQVSADTVLTGVSFDDSQIGVAYFQQETGEITTYMSKKYPANFFGTGDILSTLLAVATIQQISLHQAIPLALDFIDKSLERTLALDRDLKFGISFEPFLATLQQAFQTLKEKL